MWQANGPVAQALRLEQSTGEPAVERDRDGRPPRSFNIVFLYLAQGIFWGLLCAVPIYHSATHLSAHEEEVVLVTKVEARDIEEPGLEEIYVEAPSGTWRLGSQEVLIGDNSFRNDAVERARTEPITIIYSSVTGAFVAAPELGFDDRSFQRVIWPIIAALGLLAGLGRSVAFLAKPHSGAFGCSFFFGMLLIGVPVGWAFFSDVQMLWQRG